MNHPARAILRSVTPLVAAGCAGAVVMLSIILGLDGFVAIARAEAPIQIVNRDHKGDRLPIAPAPSVKTFRLHPPQPVDAQLAAGCEPLVSTLADSPYARTAGRCVL